MKITFGFISVCLFLSACSTTHYSLKAVPQADAKDDYFRSGLQFQTKQSDQAKVELAFDEMRANDRASFQVTITNLSSAKMDIDVNNLSCYLTSASNPKLKIAGQMIDPEAQLLSLRAQYEDLNPNGWDDLNRVLNLTTQAMSLGSDPQSQKNLQNAKAQETQMDINDAQKKQQQGSLVEQIRFWKLEVLRKTTLTNGQSVSGKVVCTFPDAPDSDELILNVNLASKVFTYPFTRFTY